MNTRPVNEEQLGAELQTLDLRVPAYAMQFSPTTWFFIAQSIEIALRTPGVPEERRETGRKLAAAMEKVFPVEFKEIHRAFDKQREISDSGESEAWEQS